MTPTRCASSALDKFNVSLGGGLDRLQGQVFRIGHLGDLNEPMILGAIAAVEMALELTGVPHGRGGVAGGDGLPGFGRGVLSRIARAAALLL